MPDREFKSLSGPALMLVLLAVAALLTRPLLPVDETRYVGVAWEMWHTGDYLVMFKNGEPYSHKPPLLFWLYNLGWAVFGVHEWWPRMVSVLFSVGGLWLAGTLARRLWPGDGVAGRNALWILASSLAWMGFSTLVMFDMMLAFFVLLGLLGLLVAADESRWRGFLMLGLAIGLGLLAKGPVILLHLLPAALTAPWWRSGMAWRRWYGGIALAVASGALIALAWAVPAAIRGGEEYRNAIFWGQTANRMVESFAHKRPIWWYLLMLPVLLFPWLLWPELWRRLAAATREGLDGGLRFCLAWMIPVFVAFSFISGKQAHYLLPLFPAFALLAGRVLSKTETPTIRVPVLLIGLIGATMLVVALTGLPGKAQSWERFPWWPGVAVILAAALTAVAARRRDGWLPSLSILSGLAFLLVQIYAAHHLWARYDVAAMAQEIKKLQDRGIPVANVGRYHDQYQLAGRLEHPLAELPLNSVKAWLGENPQGALVAYIDAADYERGGVTGRPLFTRAYRGKIAVLFGADQAGVWAQSIRTDRDDSFRDGE